jgi:hypothetical protein
MQNKWVLGYANPEQHPRSTPKISTLPHFQDMLATRPGIIPEAGKGKEKGGKGKKWEDTKPKHEAQASGKWVQSYEWSQTGEPSDHARRTEDKKQSILQEQPLSGSTEDLPCKAKFICARSHTKICQYSGCTPQGPHGCRKCDKIDEAQRKNESTKTERTSVYTGSAKNTGSARQREHSGGRASAVMPSKAKASGAAPETWITRATIFPDPNQPMIRVPADPKGSTLKDNIPLESISEKRPRSSERRSRPQTSLSGRGAREISQPLINPNAYIYSLHCSNCGISGEHSTQHCPAVNFAPHRTRGDISPDQDTTSREVVHRRHARTTESGDVRTRDSERNRPKEPPRGIPRPPAEEPTRDHVEEAARRIRPFISESQQRTQADALYRHQQDQSLYDQPAPKHARKNERP